MREKKLPTQKVQERIKTHQKEKKKFERERERERERVISFLCVRKIWIEREREYQIYRKKHGKKKNRWKVGGRVMVRWEIMERKKYIDGREKLEKV